MARSLKKLIATAEELERERIGLVSLSESIDNTMASGMLTFHVFGAVAKFKRALIRERTTAGLIEARRQAYIADVIAKVAADWPASLWDELMPWNWARGPARLAA